MRTYDLVVLVLLAWEAIRRSRGVAPIALPDIRRRSALALFGCAVAAIVISFALQTGIVDYARAHALLAPAWAAGLPIPVLFDFGPFHEPLHRLLSVAMLAIAAMQVVALYVVARTVPQLPRHITIAAVAAGAAAMAAIAVSAPALTSGDVYSYVGYARLGPAAYAPPQASLGGEFAAINAYWGLPLPASDYGPLWLASAVALVGHVPHLHDAVMLLRVQNLALFGALLAILATLRFGIGIIALVALNPVLHLQLIENAHNDVLGLVLLAGAVAAIRRPRLAVVLVAAAGLAKFPYLIVGAFILTRLPTMRARTIAIVSAVSITVAISAAIGGSGYVHALLSPVPAFPERPGAAPLRAMLIGAIVMAVAWSLYTNRRTLTGLAWALPAVAPTAYPWYFTWSVAWLAVEPAALRPLLVALPVVATLVDSVWALSGLGPPLAALVVAGFLADTVRARRPATAPIR